MTISATTQGIKPGVCTSTNKPANPFDGQVIYMTDVDQTAVWDGSQWTVLAPIAGGRNVVINGAMAIDQRNSGAAINPVGSVYTIDRWAHYASQSGKLSFQQNQGSVTPPVGFSYYSGFTSLSAFSIASTDQFLFFHKVEGYNLAKLNWGTANAKTATLSFWVRSSLTGTFGGSIQNSAQNRCFPYSYTISSANTWEYKTVVVTGDTTGTWLTTNGIGALINFSLATGSTYSGTAGAWTGTSYISSVTGAVSVVGTNAATWQVTGVQLEAGAVATPFEFEDYGVTLTKCQRYYESISWGIYYGTALGGTDLYLPLCYRVTKRATPTVTLPSSTNAIKNSSNVNATPAYAWTTNTTTDMFNIYAGSSSVWAINANTATASAEL